jgi:hypothetical protein
MLTIKYDGKRKNSFKMIHTMYINGIYKECSGKYSITNAGKTGLLKRKTWDEDSKSILKNCKNKK